MSLRNIMLLIVLGVLLAAGLLSGRIAERVYPDDMRKKTRLDLGIKGLCALVVIVLYIICFA